MTEAELLQELAVAMRGADADGFTVAQMRAQMHRSPEYIRRLIRSGLDQGVLTRGMRFVETIAGKMTPLPVYAMKPKKKSHVRAR